MELSRGADFDRSRGGLKLADPLIRCFFRTGMRLLALDDCFLCAKISPIDAIVVETDLFDLLEDSMEEEDDLSEEVGEAHLEEEEEDKEDVAEQYDF